MPTPRPAAEGLSLIHISEPTRRTPISYAVALGRLDGIAFTAGIGEHSPRLRAEVLARLGLLGIRVDADRNAGGPSERVVTADDSAVPAWVVPTNEELEIARQTLAVLR